MGKEVERLREESEELPSVKTQSAEAETTVVQMQAQVSQLILQGEEKDKEIESL